MSIMVMIMVDNYDDDDDDDDEYKVNSKSVAEITRKGQDIELQLGISKVASDCLQPWSIMRSLHQKTKKLAEPTFQNSEQSFCQLMIYINSSSRWPEVKLFTLTAIICLPADLRGSLPSGDLISVTGDGRRREHKGSICHYPRIISAHFQLSRDAESRKGGNTKA